MKLKDGLILREVAGQYVIIPTGKRVREIHEVVYLNGVGTFLWNYIGERDVAEEDLVDLLQKRYPKTNKEQIQKDVRTFVEALASHHLLEDGGNSGRAFARFPEKWNENKNKETNDMSV